MITNPDPKSLYRSCFNLHGNPINTLVLSVWRTAFASVLFETDKSRITLAVSNPYAAIAERLARSKSAALKTSPSLPLKTHFVKIATVAAEY